MKEQVNETEIINHFIATQVKTGRCACKRANILHNTLNMSLSFMTMKIDNREQNF